MQNYRLTNELSMRYSKTSGRANWWLEGSADWQEQLRRRYKINAGTNIDFDLFLWKSYTYYIESRMQSIYNDEKVLPFMKNYNWYGL